MAEFENLFTCPLETMFEIADKIKRLTDESISSLFDSISELNKYMLFNPTFTRTFLAVGILKEYLKNHLILVTGKTALQLTAVVNDDTIKRLNQSLRVVSFDQFIAPGVCISKPCSDFDISLISVHTATPSLKQTFLGTFLLFFNNLGTTIYNCESPDVLPATYERFRQTEKIFLVLRSRGSPDTISVKTNLGRGRILDVLDVKFKTKQEISATFPGLKPVFCQIEIMPSSMMPGSSMMPRSMMPRSMMPGSMMPSSMLMPGSMMPSSMLMPGSIPVSALIFPLPDLQSFLHECVQITIKELTKLLENKSIVGDDNYFFVITTLLKFFSRAVQLSYIISGKGSGVPSTRVVFDREVALFPPNEEMNDIIIAILHLFLIDDNTLNPETFRAFANYKETRKHDSESRKVMSFHDKIIEILTRFEFNLPPPNRMGGKKNKLKTKRKAMKERKTRKARKTRKSNQNNKKKRFTRNISPYKLTNKSRGRRTRKY
jgi:hypothetical protein